MTNSRYIRQEALPQMGAAGQATLAAAKVVVMGMGALGSVSAELLSRAGVGLSEAGGWLRLVDRDYCDLSNLQRCALYNEDDAKNSKPKALAAAEHLALINSEVALEARATHISPANILELCAGANLILDGSDNFELRYLINEAADQLRMPWIYAGALATLGMVMPITSAGACFMCFAPQPPAPGNYPTCASAGILAATTRVVANLQVALGLKLLLGQYQPVLAGAGLAGAGWAGAGLAGAGLAGGKQTAAPATTLLQLDVWEGELNPITIPKNPNCPVCGQHTHQLLNAGSSIQATTLCGRDEYQVLPPQPMQLDLAGLAGSLRHQGQVLASPVILSFDNGQLRFKLFSDGRMMLKGARDEQQALSIYSEYVGI